VDRAVCDGCGACAGECPAAALELLGRSWSVEGLVNEVVKDASYFGSSGGVTASGGEAALQAPFVAAIFKELMSRGIHTALDTSGQCPWDSLDMIFPYTDLLLYDIKEIDTARHREFTGSGNERILDNLTRAAEYARNHTRPKEIWIRTPVIPGATDRNENIAGIGSFIAGHLHGMATRWELCAFNNLCRDKYRRLGKEWAYGASGLMEREAMEELSRTAQSSGVDPAIVCWSGSTEFSTDENRKPEIAYTEGQQLS
jgi:pyruvate formate lyase activating enzyme